MGPELQVDVAYTTDRLSNGLDIDRAEAGELRVTWTPTSALKIWTEGRQRFDDPGNSWRPNHIAGGASFRVNRQVSLEMQHRQVLAPGDTC